VVKADFGCLKAIDLDLRPVRRTWRTGCGPTCSSLMLAAYLAWHLRKAWAPLCFTDEEPS